MSDETHIEISCPSCGEVYATKASSTLEPDEVSRFFPCRICGHETGHVGIELPPVKFKVDVGMRAVGKDPLKSGKRKRVLEARAEPTVEKKIGRAVFHERMIDKNLDRYTEKVTVRKTGEVIHHTDEPLSEHRGHGSAKKKSDSDG